MSVKQMFHMLFAFILLLSSQFGNALERPARFSSAEEIKEFNSGLQFTVKNSLPLHRGKKVKLTAHFCPALVKDAPPAQTFTTGGDLQQTPAVQVPTQRGECVQMAEKVSNGKEHVFYISDEQLAEIYIAGHGKVNFRFIDSQQFTNQAYGCDSGDIKIKANFGKKQSYFVEVTERNLLSYGCIIDRL